MAEKSGPRPGTRGDHTPGTWACTVPASMPAGAPRLLVVSHPCVIEANQSVYADLADLGWDVHLVVPARWRDPYHDGPFAPTFMAALRDRARAVPVVGAGREQRYLHLRSPGRIVDEVSPDVIFLEQEPFAMVTGQWMGAARRRGIPLGLQHDENLDRHMH